MEQIIFCGIRDFNSTIGQLQLIDVKSKVHRNIFDNNFWIVKSG